MITNCCFRYYVISIHFMYYCIHLHTPCVFELSIYMARVNTARVENDWHNMSRFRGHPYRSMQRNATHVYRVFFRWVVSTQLTHILNLWEPLGSVILERSTNSFTGQTCSPIHGAKMCRKLRYSSWSGGCRFLSTWFGWQTCPVNVPFYQSIEASICWMSAMGDCFLGYVGRYVNIPCHAIHQADFHYISYIIYYIYIPDLMKWGSPTIDTQWHTVTHTHIRIATCEKKLELRRQGSQRQACRNFDLKV